MKSMLALTALAALAFGAFAAQAAPGVAHAATEVELRHAAARVVVIPENRPDVSLVVSYGSSTLPKIMVHEEGNKLIADGKLDHHSMSCRDNSINVAGFGQIDAAGLPLVTIRVPLDAKVSFGGASIGQVGASKTLEFDQGGCGNWKIGDVSGKGEINIGGSGSVEMANLGEAEVNIGGSGSFHAKGVGRLEGNIGGHGDIDADTITGDSEINIGGSGNVNLNGGTSPKMEINVAGSGHVNFGGEVHDLEVNIVGSGDVHVKKVTGNVSKSVMGSGNIVIGQ